ncbi:MAG TPA: MFS transporter [Bryobacteraceae bacterium]|nr:MFS transporter [Bryobacteraceae bacterium]
MIPAVAAPPKHTSGVRHAVVALGFCLGLVLFLDRAALSVMAPSIRRDLHLGPAAMGAVFTAFVWGYALLNLPAGALCDRYGARRMLTAIVLLWSAFTALTAAAWDLISLLGIRFLFGAAESGATPGVSQSYARWIPVVERARAQGFYLAGMSAGVALAPPLVTAAMMRWGWRVTFQALGAAGVVWAAAWFRWYRDDPQIGRAPERELPAAAVRVDWRKVLATPGLWALLLMYFTYGYTGYIYITWFPSYLIEGRHLPAGLAGTLAAAPGVFGLFAKPFGGWISDRLTARFGLRAGRCSVGMIGFGLAAIAVIPGLLVSNPYWAAMLLATGDGAAALAHGVCLAVCIDTGMERAGTISGMMLTAGSLGNAASALAFGTFLEFTGSWTAPFLLGVAANAAGALLWLKIHPERPFV